MDLQGRLKILIDAHHAPHGQSEILNQKTKNLLVHTEMVVQLIAGR